MGKTIIKNITNAGVVSTGNDANITYYSYSTQERDMEKIYEEVKRIIDEHLEGRQKELLLAELENMPKEEPSASDTFQKWRERIELASNIAGISSFIMAVFEKFL